MENRLYWSEVSDIPSDPTLETVERLLQEWILHRPQGVRIRPTHLVVTPEDEAACVVLCRVNTRYPDTGRSLRVEADPGLERGEFFLEYRDEA
jgi:hypothetical protein